MCVWLCFFFFFFKQKTAYEMRISDWSSDVCSSDLSAQVRRCRREETASDHRTERRRSRASQTEHRRIFANRVERVRQQHVAALHPGMREEGREPDTEIDISIDSAEPQKAGQGTACGNAPGLGREGGETLAQALAVVQTQRGS